MLKVLVACGCGMGSSQMIKKNCSTVLTSLGIEHTIHHTSIGEAKASANNYDLVVVGSNFEKHLKVKETTKVIGLKNLLNKVELKTKLQEAGYGNE
jgi:PTS system ascorbate-specific IIB component